MKQIPSVPKGTRDFSPETMVKRNYIFDSIKSIFVKYGFQPLETPAMENLSSLMGKYGEEGDKLLFKILNSGNFLSSIEDDSISKDNYKFLSTKVSEKGLRYDLTVPFARFVVQHQNEISFPFKRYQIQPVWRADRPQKGRYREFYQCDIDVIGSKSLLNEVEIIQIVADVYNKLNINAELIINNRKILSGISEVIGHKDKITEITVALDKIEKIGKDKAFEELVEKGIHKDAVSKLEPIIDIRGCNNEKLDNLRTLLSESSIGLEGIGELEKIFNYIDLVNPNISIRFDVSLARGLSYYTGAIFEVKALNFEIGSITGGGRYDNLTGIFGLDNMSGVGISFGADRIYDVMENLKLFPSNSHETTHVLFINFGEKEEKVCLNIIKDLRNNGINVEIYPEFAKMKKQMGYANKKEIPYVAIIGEDELVSSTITIKHMESGDQITIPMSETITYITNKINL